jgi:hypothetical protein
MQMDSHAIQSAQQSDLTQKSLVFSKTVLMIFQLTGDKSVITAQKTSYLLTQCFTRESAGLQNVQKKSFGRFGYIKMN